MKKNYSHEMIFDKNFKKMKNYECRKWHKYWDFTEKAKKIQ